MNSLKKIAIGFGLVSVITLQGLQANKVKECEREEDKKVGCVEIEYHSNGEIKGKLPYKNGLINGVLQWYYENGNLEQEQSYRNNKQHGITKEYYESGKIMKEIPYKNDWQDGIEKEYYENGKIKAEMSYKNGERDGVAKKYHENGKLKEEYAFIENQQHGDHKFYSNDGKFLGMARYKHGNMQFVKCAEKKLDSSDLHHLMSDAISENFEAYCK